MGHQLLLFHAHLHPHTRSVPPTRRSLLQVPKKTRRLASRLRPPHPEPGGGATPRLFPLPLDLQSPGLLETPHQGSLLGVSPTRLANSGPLPPHQKTPPHRRHGTPNRPPY